MHMILKINDNEVLGTSQTFPEGLYSNNKISALAYSNLYINAIHVEFPLYPWETNSKMCLSCLF